LSVRAARDAYFAASGFDIAGYAERWVVLRVAGFPVWALPNVAARRRAVPLHDLHHVATGYDASWVGEAEISAFELGAGCGDYWFARIINLAGIWIGALFAPRRLLFAYARGRASGSLYIRGGAEELLDRDLDQLRAALALDRPAPQPVLGDVFRLGALLFAAPLLAGAALAKVALFWLRARPS
jgi:hypothetical protein